MSAVKERVLEPEKTTLSIPITGMTCATCTNTVTRALEGVEGVAAAEVSLATERAAITS